jgi:hypothetical protein
VVTDAKGIDDELIKSYLDRVVGRYLVSIASGKLRS